jgi:hypothetical protein
MAAAGPAHSPAERAKKLRCLQNETFPREGDRLRMTFLSMQGNVSDLVPGNHPPAFMSRRGECI